MLKKSAILILFLLSTFFLKFVGEVYAASLDSKIAPVRFPDEIEKAQAKQLDRQAEILTNYLAKFDSPLQYHAQDFVDAAKSYNVNWKLVPAIAGVESTFGKFIPGGYNAWGWGVYGTQAIYFDSWREGIFTVTRGLKENYINKGLKDPYAMNRIYAASPTWGSKVSYFLSELDKFEREYNSAHPAVTEVNPGVKTAALSGQLAFRQE